VARVPLEPLHRLEGALDPGGHPGRPDPPEVVGRQRRQEVHADVGRRCPVGHHRLGIDLQVVGGQPPVVLVDEVFEEAPCPSGEAPQGGDRVRVQALQGRVLERTAQP
jgi:hypothetical protein